MVDNSGCLGGLLHSLSRIPQGADETGDGRLGFDRRVRLEFLGTQLSSDGGLLVMRELDDVLGLSDAHRLTRPVGRPSQTRIKRFYEDFAYQAQSWDKPRRVIAKIEWHPGELFPRVGFIVTNMPMEPDWVVRFYNQRGTAEQHIKEGKYAFHWTRLSCKPFRDNEVRLQLHALAYNLATFLRCIDLPEAMANWSLTSLQLKLIKIGARVVRHARAITFQLAEMAVTGPMWAILTVIHRLRAPPSCA